MKQILNAIRARILTDTPKYRLFSVVTLAFILGVTLMALMFVPSGWPQALYVGLSVFYGYTLKVAISDLFDHGDINL